MFHRVFQGSDFSYLYDNETDNYLLHWRKYEINITLKDEDAHIFQQQLELIKSEPDKDKKGRIERTIGIYFYLKFACPMPHFSEA